MKVALTGDLASGLELDLDEAGFDARGNLAGKFYSVTHGNDFAQAATEVN